MEFCLIIDMVKSTQALPNWNGQSYYADNHFDQIQIANRQIVIHGSRSKISSLSTLLFNTSSSLYRQIIKALSFYYLCTGDALLIEKITLKSNNSETYETEFLQPFQKSLDPIQPMMPNELDILFSNNANVDLFLNGIIYYIKAIQDNNFDNYWKSFNSIYSIISSSDKENEKLRNIRCFIEQNKHRFSRTLSFVSNNTAQNIRSLRIREFILNNWPNQNSTKAFADMVKRFTDIRIITILNETLPYRIEFLRNEGLEQDVRDHLYCQKNLSNKDDVQLLCFYILKYAYFIRNKYFHAEKASPIFILKDSSELRELSKISEILQLFLADLIQCNSLYI